MKRILVIIPYGRTSPKDLFEEMWKSVEGAIINTKNEVSVVIVTPNQVNIENVTIIPAREDVGAGEARNIGLRYAETILDDFDCYTFIDADDRVTKNYFSIPDGNWDICQTRRAILGEKAFVRTNSRLFRGIIKKSIDNRSERLLKSARYGRFGEQCWSRFYDKKYAHLRMPEYGIWEDSVYFRLIMMQKPTIEFSYGVYIWRRTNSNSMTKKYIDERNLIYSLNNLKFIEIDNFINGITGLTPIYKGLRLLEFLSNQSLVNRFKTFELGNTEKYIKEIS